MTIKDIEKQLNRYLELDEKFNHKANALNEIDNIRKTFKLDDISHIVFIVDNYPNYDHFLFRLTDDKNMFFTIGLSRNYLKSLTKKQIHSVAKGIHSVFGKYDLEKII